jgi:hypothetical protein
MGVVYAVMDPTVQRPVALKLIRRNGINDEALQRFFREAEILAKIKHRNVIRIHRTGELPEGPYLLEELVEGDTLQRVAEQGGLPPLETARVMRDLTDAVAAIHAHGILHRDLKPANVVLQDGKVPVLLDFGVAREMDSQTLTKTGAAIGTPGYMSPEQADGIKGVIGPPADVYGLGAVLFQLLTGNMPYEGSMMAVFTQILSGKASPRPSASQTDVCPELEAICVKAMAKPIGDRYASAAAMRDDLDLFLGGEIPKAASELRATSRQNLRRLALIGALVVTVASAVLWVALEHGADTVVEARPVATRPPQVTAPPEQGAPGPLWDLGDTQRLTYLFHFEEHVPGLPSFVRIRGTLELELAESTDDDELHFDCTISRLRAGIAHEEDRDFDSAAPNGKHVFRRVAIGVGKPFALVIARATGAVRVTGATALGTLMSDAVKLDTNLVLHRGKTARFMRQAFSDEFLQRGLTCLTQVRDGREPAPLIWRTGVAPGDFTLTSESVPWGIPPVASRSQDDALDSSSVFDQTGEAHYTRGRLSSAKATQVRTLNGRPYADDEAGYSRSTWSLTLQD